jgi:hypothetical protein
VHSSKGYNDLEEYIKEIVEEEDYDIPSSEKLMYLVKLGDMLPLDTDHRGSKT